MSPAQPVINAVIIGVQGHGLRIGVAVLSTEVEDFGGGREFHANEPRLHSQMSGRWRRLERSESFRVRCLGRVER